MKSAAARALADAIETASAHATPVEREPSINADGDPLDVMRALLGNATAAIARLRLDSPRLNQARAEARAITKAIEGMERERSAKETPDELERRRRREDGETRARIEKYVLEHEADAAAKGVCVHCGAPMGAGE